MVTKRFRCRNCGRRFKAEVYEKGEAGSQAAANRACPLPWV